MDKGKQGKEDPKEQKGKDQKKEDKNEKLLLPTDDTVPIKSVTLDALVVMKIIKHCSESAPSLVAGQLLGWDVGGDLQITYCFPFPLGSKEGEDEVDLESGSEYHQNMIRQLNKVDVEDNTVGWYQSAYFGTYIDENAITSQIAYQSSISKSVAIFFDPFRARQGVTFLKAFRLNPEFVKYCKEDKIALENLTVERFREKIAEKFSLQIISQTGLNRTNLFEEIPIRIHNSLLVNALTLQLEEKFYTPSLANMEMQPDPFLEKSMEYLQDRVAALSVEQSRIQYQIKSMRALRRQKGEEEKDEDAKNISRFEGLLINNQIDSYCKQINRFAGQSLGKLFLSGAIIDHDD